MVTVLQPQVPLLLGEETDDVQQNPDSFLDHYFIQRAAGLCEHHVLSTLETYRLGKAVGQGSQQLFAPTSNYLNTSFLEKLFVLINWWSKSSLANYGWLVIAPNCSLQPFMSLRLINRSKIQFTNRSLHHSYALYAGVIGGFFGGLVSCNFDAILADQMRPETDICNLFLGHQEAIEATQFWQGFND